jgi:threonine/homoserine/homoserine lactone efflux protein
MEMPALIGAAGLITVAAITPGPNNLVVMHVAARAGVIAALPIIVATVLGSIALLVLVAAGAGALLEAQPVLATILTVAGCLYLSWMGLVLIVRTSAESSTGRALPEHPLGMFAFQFVNPKAWVMVVTASAALNADMDAHTAFIALAALFVSIPTLCLLLWSALGARLTSRLERRSFRVWFDRVMGFLLIVFSALLLI